MRERVCSFSIDLVCDQSTEITKFGMLGKKIAVYNYSRVFGESKREIKRVVLVKNYREYLGMYSVSEFPVQVEGRR